MAKKPTRKERLAAANALFRRMFDDADVAQKRKVGRRERLRIYDEVQNMAQWAEKYCPHHLRNQKTGEPVPFAEIHYDLLGIICFRKRILVVLPRGFGKSTICTLIYPLYLVCEKRARYIMLGSFADYNARKFVVRLRKEIENNHYIRDDYGDLRNIDDKWTDEMFITADDVCVEAIYFGKAATRGSIHGFIRPEVAILDDLETKDEAISPDRVSAVINWIYDEVCKLYYDIQVIINGTILADGSAVHHLVEAAEGELTDDAIDGNKAKSRFRLVMVEACDENFNHLAWPDLFTKAVLMQMYGKEEDEHDSFDQEMRHIPRSRKHRSFHTFHEYHPDEIKDHPLRLIMYVDPIPGVSDLKPRKTKDSDYYARLILAQSRLNKKLYILSAFHERGWTKAQMVTDVLNTFEFFAQDYSGFSIGVESNTFQLWFASEVHEVGADRGLYPHVEPIDAKGDKIERITSLDHLVNTGWILFNFKDPGQVKLKSELIHILSARYHDDLADCLEGCVRQLRANPSGKWQVRTLMPRVLARFFSGRDKERRDPMKKDPNRYADRNIRRRDRTAGY